MLAKWGNIGNLVLTKKLDNDTRENSLILKEVNQAVHKYINADWGELGADEKHMNDEAVKSNKNKILAKYKTSKGNIYIITEWDRSVTTILYCDEY